LAEQVTMHGITKYRKPIMSLKQVARGSCMNGSIDYWNDVQQEMARTVRRSTRGNPLHATDGFERTSRDSMLQTVP
jgi:hypothetical protein